MSASLLISVVICTHNRAGYLRDALASVLRQDFPAEQREVVVVDNASTDDTRDVVAAFATHGVRYVHEARLGHTFARNAGWRAARGVYIAYLDDDAVAEPTWLSALRDGFAAVAPNHAVLGGRVEPIWLAERPAWLSDELALCLPVIDWGDKPRPLAEIPTEWLAGVNMAMPRALIEQMGGFDERLGRQGKNLLSNDDTWFQRNAQKRGCPCLYDPRAGVRHIVPPTRLDQKWFVQRYYWQGISDAVMEVVETGASKPQRWWRALVRAARLLASRRTLADALRPISPDPQAFTRKCVAMIAVGHIAGLLGAAGR